MTKNDIKNQLLVQADETSGMDGNVRRKIFRESATVDIH